MERVETFISNLRIGEPAFHGGLTVFPLATRASRPFDYLLLAEALGEGLVRVGEVSEGGSVPDLVVENRAKRPVLIMDGEELVGAKQNRVANLTLLIPAKGTTVIPVSCVEAGRWSYDRPDFQTSGRVHFRSGRAARVASVQESARASGSRRSDQGAVWRDIDAMAENLDARSDTAAMSEMYERHEGSIDDYARALPPVEGQVGAIFAIGDRELGLDAFDRPETLAAFLPKLVASYAVDVLGRRAQGAKPATADAARNFLARLGKGTREAFPAVGLGRDVLISADGAIGGALMVDDVVVHLTAFSDPRSRARHGEADPRAERPSRTHRQRRHALRRRRGRRPGPDSGPAE